MIVSELQAKLDKMPQMATVMFEESSVDLVRQVGPDEVILRSAVEKVKETVAKPVVEKVSKKTAKRAAKKPVVTVDED